MDKNNLERRVIEIIHEHLGRKITEEDRRDNYLPVFNIIDEWVTEIMAIAYSNDLYEAVDYVYDLQKSLEPKEGTLEKVTVTRRIRAANIRFKLEIYCFQLYLMLRDTEDDDTIIHKISFVLRHPPEDIRIKQDISESYGVKRYGNIIEEFDDYSDDGYDNEDSDDEDDILKQAEDYTYSSIVSVLDGFIKDFYAQRLTPDQLYILSKLAMIVRDPNKYDVDGYIHFTVKENRGNESFIYQEIQFDGDGLRLTNGGYEMDENGGDSFSDEIFPVYDEEEALGIISVIDSFIEEFDEKVRGDDRIIEAEDVIDRLTIKRRK
ncbi:MAG TPA: hypothetical protein VNS32_27905 [Flavisolibacter sp.]|nr:hypothetical protein [Flavisolibacter sp.]